MVIKVEIYHSKTRELKHAFHYNLNNKEACRRAANTIITSLQNGLVVVSGEKSRMED